MKSEIQDYINHCEECQRNKVAINRKKNIPLKLVTSSSSVMEKIHIDTIGPFRPSDKNNIHCLTIIEELSRFLICVPIPNLDAETIIEALIFNVFNIFGYPRYIVSDNFSSFQSDLMKRVAKYYKIKHIFTTIYNPQANGLIERPHNTIKTMIKSFLNKDLTNWCTLVRMSVAAYNRNYHDTIKTAPSTLMFAREQRSLISDNNQIDYNYDDFLTRLKQNARIAEAEAKKHILEARITQKARYDKNTAEFNVKVGDKVVLKTHYVSSKKLLPNFSEPATVVEVSDQYVTILNKANKTQKIHKNNLKKFNEKD